VIRHCAVEDEIHDGRWILFQNDHFVSFVPYAAESPCEIYVVPKIHRADLRDISDDEKTSADAIEALVLNWYVQIQPRLTTLAEFEMGLGIRINRSLPEADAALLKG
jgi:UDPglucose--hexose-1-phosphate uridylyltransferase